VGLAARASALERYGLARFLDRWNEVLADLRTQPAANGHRHPHTARLEEQIPTPARERNIP
jgi:hypothetical protein